MRKIIVVLIILISSGAIIGDSKVAGSPTNWWSGEWIAKEMPNGVIILKKDGKSFLMIQKGEMEIPFKYTKESDNFSFSMYGVTVVVKFKNQDTIIYYKIGKKKKVLKEMVLTRKK